MAYSGKFFGASAYTRRSARGRILNMKIIGTLFLCCSLLLVSASHAMSALVDLPDVDGIGYFKDNATGLTWMDVDNFLNMSTADVIDLVAESNFRLATFSDLQNMQNQPNMVFSDFAAIIGYAQYLSGKKIIWGFYVNEGDGSRVYASALSEDSTQWSYLSYDYIEGKSPFCGAFVVSSTQSEVPLPSSVIFLFSGFISLYRYRLKNKKIAEQFN